MRKISLLILSLSLFACSIPRTPTDADLLSASTQFREELFESGARGQVILGILKLVKFIICVQNLKEMRMIV